MKIKVKTLNGTHFEIEVKPEETVADVKEKIETAHVKDAYPAAQQVLIHQGKVLKDGMTLEENNIAENSFLVLMLSKVKASTSGASTTSSAPTNQVFQPASSLPPTSIPPSITSQPPASTVVHGLSNPEQTPASAPAIFSDSSIYGQAASNLVAGHGLESTIQQILDIGGGSWDRDTVIRALRAAFNNPQRAIEYLYSGIPEQAEVPAVDRDPAVGQVADPPVQASQPAVPASGPNADPLNLFPQGVPNIGTHLDAANLDFLRNDQQFKTLRAMVQANSHILQSMLQELQEQDPKLMRLVEENQSDLLSLINEPIEGKEDPAAAMPESIILTPEEVEAIQRLEDMGFAHELVMEVFFACGKNEELAANYLLDHQHEFDD